MAWQPIDDTVPEGVPILVRGPEGVSLVERDDGYWFVHVEGGLAWTGSDSTDVLMRATAPTEWHPVPD